MSASPLRRVAFAMPVLALAATVAATTGASAKPVPAYYGFGGSGYGTTAKVGSAVNSGASSYITMCSTKPGSRTDHIAGVNLGAAGSVGAVTTKLQSKNGSSKSSVSTTTTSGLNLLSGLIQASTVTSTATVSHDKSGYHRSGSSKLLGLRIAGVPIDASVPKNTTIQLPAGLGRVVLNAQVVSARYGSYKSTTQAISVYLNDTGLPGLGSGRIVVSSAHAELHAPVHARPYGSAYGTQVNVANGTVSSGPTAPSYLPCAGTTGNKTSTNSTAALSVGDLVRTGVVSSYVKSSDSTRSTTATTGAKVAGVNLLGGRIKVDALTAQANAKRSGSKLTRTSTGTKVVGLTVNGRSVSFSGKENQKIEVPGIATVYLNRVVRTGSQIQVYGLQVKLLTDTNGGKAGATINIGSARAGVSSR